MKYKIGIFLLFCVQFLFAQESRIEFLVANPGNLMQVFNLKEKGLIYLVNSNNGNLVIKKIDTQLEEQWQIETSIESKSQLLDSYNDDKNLYLLLQENKINKLSVLKISTLFGAVQKYDVKTFSDFNLSEFKVNNNVICIAGLVKKTPILILSDQNSEIPKYISSGLNGESSIQSLDMDDEHIHVTYLNNGNKQTQLIFRSYTHNGKLENSEVIDSSDDYDFLSAKFYETNSQKMIIGNYGIKGASYNDFSSSQGIYIYDVLHKNKLRFYGFDKLNNFLNFLNSKEKDRIEKQVQKKKDKGSEFKFDYRLLINEVNEINNNLVISSEVYLPVYRNSYNSPNSAYGVSPYYGNSVLSPSVLWSSGSVYGNSLYSNPAMWGYNNRSVQYLEGFRYLEGVIVNINNNGEIVWDVAVPYANIRNNVLKPHLKIANDSTKTILSYVNNDKMIVQKISKNGALEQNLAIANDPDFKGNKYQHNEFDNYEYWYHNFFLNYGIKKGSVNENKKSVQFYIEKIPF